MKFGVLKRISLIIIFTFLSGADNTGKELYNKGQFKEAQEYYLNQSLERGAEPEVQFGYGASTYQLEEIDEAIRAFEAVSKSNDPLLSSQAYYNLGNAYYKKQDVENSLAAYKKALELNPDDLDAKNNFEMIKRQMQNQQQDKNKDQDQNQNQKNQKNNQSQDQQKSKDQSQDKQNDQKNQDKDKQDDKNSDNQEKDKQDKQSEPEEDQENQDQNSGKQEEQKNPEFRNAEAILNSLKKDEKINQKRQIAKAKTRTLEKDW